MSETPRTDAIAHRWSNGDASSPEAKELYEHARELEREVKAFRRAILHVCAAAEKHGE